MDNSQGTILSRKKRVIKFSDQEVILILKAYIEHPSCWLDIIGDVKENMHQLNDKTREYYMQASNKQIRDRMSTKLHFLMSRIEHVSNNQIRQMLYDIRENNRAAQPEPTQVDHNEAVIPPARARRVGSQPCLDQRQTVQTNHVPVLHEVDLEPDRPAPDHEGAHRPGAAPAFCQGGLQPGPSDANKRDGRRRRAAGTRALMSRNMENSDSSDDEQNAQPQQKRARRRPLADLVLENHLLYNRFMTKKMPKILHELGIDSD